MKCTICRGAYRLTAYNRSSICVMCQSVSVDDKHMIDDDIEIEWNIMRDRGRTLPVFDSDHYESSADHDDSHGL